MTIDHAAELLGAAIGGVAFTLLAQWVLPRVTGWAMDPGSRTGC